MAGGDVGCRDFRAHGHGHAVQHQLAGGSNDVMITDFKGVVFDRIDKAEIGARQHYRAAVARLNTCWRRSARH
jgi:hypothetical protein